MYLFVAGTFAMLIACSGGTTDGAATEGAAEVAVCSNTGEPCLADHSCCATEEVAKCCGGTSPDCCAGGEEGDHDHSHDHSDGESHDHEHDHSDGEDHDHEH